MGIFVRTGFVTFTISDSAESWPAIETWIARRRPSDILLTHFSARELDAASWLAMRASWHHGYPQPEEKSAYLSATYDLSAYCAACGTGRRQVHPFRMKREPRWGSRGILQLNWIFDEFFVRPDVWELVFKPRGITSMPVLAADGGDISSVLQLVIDDEVSFDVAPLTREHCGACGNDKYIPVTRGKLPEFARQPTADLCRSLQWFGSGKEAHHEVIVSQDLRQAMKAHRVRGTEFVPCSEAASAAVTERTATRIRTPLSRATNDG
jgi:hypothetical protein